MNVVIIKYGTGNTYSLDICLQRMGIDPIVTDDYELIRSADKVILPGVGAAATAMNSLKEKKLDMLLPGLTAPVLGICLGMQLMCRYSEEGDVPCLGIFNEQVEKFKGSMKIPHIGWNNITALQSPLFKGIAENAFMYFVHSYYAPLGDNTIATVDYGKPYSAALQKDNFYGVQFHPEKSGSVGVQIIDNFLKL